MIRIAPYLAGGLAVIVAMDYVPAATRHLSLASASELPLSHTAASAKADRLAAPRAAEPSRTISTVEVVGLQDPAIVYRDRDGRELFRTDPLNNVTVVTKGLSLPEVTVRQQANSRVKPMPVREIDETRDRPSDRTRPAAPGKPAKLPVGCESAFSPVASPAMAHHMGRCMS
jgi:hypothetical protein